MIDDEAPAFGGREGDDDGFWIKPWLGWAWHR